MDLKPELKRSFNDKKRVSTAFQYLNLSTTRSYQNMNLPIFALNPRFHENSDPRKAFYENPLYVLTSQVRFVDPKKSKIDFSTLSTSAINQFQMQKTKGLSTTNNEHQQFFHVSNLAWANSYQNTNVQRFELNRQFSENPDPRGGECLAPFLKIFQELKLQIQALQHKCSTQL